MKPWFAVLLLALAVLPAAETAAIETYPPPAGRVSVTLGGESRTLWPFTGEDFSGAPKDPVNVVLLGDADPRIVRQTLLALDGNRTPYGLPPAFPFDCTWSDAIGVHQTAWAARTGWQGSAVELQCGAYSTLRVHLRLFRMDGYTLGGAHFEVMIPGTTEHEVLSWELAEMMVKLDLVRSGALTAAPTVTPVINPAPTYRAIRPQVFNPLLGPLGALMPLLGLPTTPQSAPIPIPSNGQAVVLRLQGILQAETTDTRIEFDHPFDQVIPKPFCAASPYDYLKVLGSLRMVHRVQTNPSGRYWTNFQANGVLSVVPVNPLTGEATGAPYEAVVSELHRADLSDQRSESQVVTQQTLVSDPQQSYFLDLWAGHTDRLVRMEECGQ